MKQFKPKNTCKIKPTVEDLKKITEMAEALYKDWRKVFAFIQKNKSAPAECMIYTLRAVLDKKPKNYWSYASTVIDKITPYYYNQQFLKEHEARKTIPSAGDILKAIMSGVNKEGIKEE